MKMRSLVFHSAESVELVDAPIPVPGPGEALIRVRASGICGSELHAAPGSNPGHEAVGHVHQISETSAFEIGEFVGLSAVTGCGACGTCSRGEQTFCSNTAVHSGMHADFVKVPVAALRKLPAGIDPADAVLLSGDACGVPIRALRRVPHAAGARVVVIGLGPVGLAHVLVRSRADAEVIAIEPSPYRRALALSLGAQIALAPGDDAGEPPDMVIECTGIPACAESAFDMVRPGGTVLQSGICSSLEINPAKTFVVKEVVYTGTWYYSENDFHAMTKMYAEGLPVHEMTTHEFGCESVAEAFRQFVTKESGKIVLHWNSAPDGVARV